MCLCALVCACVCQSQALDSIVDVKICCSIWGICLVSMATKDLPAGRVFWSLKQRQKKRLGLKKKEKRKGIEL